MPIYEYRCEVCGANEEKIQPISASIEHDCSACNAPTAMKRQISRTAFTLAGGGWYASGYGEGGAKATTSTSVPSGSTSAESAESAPADPKPDSGCNTGCACHSPVVQKAIEKA